MIELPIGTESTAESGLRLRRIRKVSRVFRYFFLFLLVIMGGFAIAMWFLPIQGNTITIGFNTKDETKAEAVTTTKKEEAVVDETKTISMRIGSGSENQVAKQKEKIRPGYEWILRGIQFMMVLLQMVALWIAQRLFGCYEKGMIFDPKAVQCIRWTGWWMVAYWAEQNFLELTDLLTMNPAFVDFHIDALLAGGVLVLLISWIMQEGCKLKQEQELTI